MRHGGRSEGDIVRRQDGERRFQCTVLWVEVVIVIYGVRRMENGGHIYRETMME